MRELGPITLFIACALALGAGIYWYSAPAGSPVSSTALASTQVAFTVLASGSDSSVAMRTNYRITSADELRSLWKLISIDGIPPVVDFTQDDVIAVFAGDEPTAGYSIAVSGVADSATARLVSVEIDAPGITCLAAKTPIEPYEVLALPKTALSYAHEDTATTTSCLQ